mmetsp:Transcript_14054/g.30524  ORF Transcript_14054/g.30524 Transcript_14054/m.30524 type:complete len:386 (+) Transcript_14054:379-1536(+)
MDTENAEQQPKPEPEPEQEQQSASPQQGVKATITDNPIVPLAVDTGELSPSTTANTASSPFTTAFQYIYGIYYDAFLGPEAEHAPPPSYQNWGNLIGFFLNLLVTYGIGVRGAFGLPTNSELSTRYQTLVTPAPWTFSIWSVIFISQLIFAFAQIMPKYRTQPQVKDGVKFYYLATCGFQIIWTILFSSQLFWGSFVAMLGILVMLTALLDSQASATSDKSWKEFWLFRFPFQIHYAWIVAATLVNVSVALVEMDAGTSLQVFVAVASLVILVGVSIFVLFVPKKPKFVVPIVLAWATAGMWEELSDPTSYMKAHFWGRTLERLQIGVAATCLVIIAATVIRAGLYFYRKEGREASIDLIEVERGEESQAESGTPYVNIEDGTYA